MSVFCLVQTVFLIDKPTFIELNPVVRMFFSNFGNKWLVFVLPLVGYPSLIYLGWKIKKSLAVGMGGFVAGVSFVDFLIHLFLLVG